VNKLDYLSLMLFADDVLETLLLADVLNELVKLMKDVLMVYYNDQDKELYAEIIRFYDEDEECPRIL
jgi:hypothetical protein